jgi:hypothetical protein
MCAPCCSSGFLLDSDQLGASSCEAEYLWATQVVKLAEGLSCDAARGVVLASSGGGLERQVFPWSLEAPCGASADTGYNLANCADHCSRIASRAASSSGATNMPALRCS